MDIYNIKIDKELYYCTLKYLGLSKNIIAFQLIMYFFPQTKKVSDHLIIVTSNSKWPWFYLKGLGKEGCIIVIFFVDFN